MKPIKENNFIWLTIAMIGSMLARAFSEEFPEYLALHVIEYVNVFFLLVALISLRSNGSWLKGLLAVIALMFLMVVARRVTFLPNFDIVYLVFLLFFYSAAIWLVGRQVLLTGSVDLNKMVGSIALYFMLGLFFSVLYTMLLQFSPEALNGIGPNPIIAHLSPTNYFSFVVLTTLGFGEITPVGPLARVLVTIEAVTGMFYLAMVVASLVGSMARSAELQADEQFFGKEK